MVVVVVVVLVVAVVLVMVMVVVISMKGELVRKEVKKVEEEGRGKDEKEKRG